VPPTLYPTPAVCASVLALSANRHPRPPSCDGCSAAGCLTSLRFGNEKLFGVLNISAGGGGIDATMHEFHISGISVCAGCKLNAARVAEILAAPAAAGASELPRQQRDMISAGMQAAAVAKNLTAAARYGVRAGARNGYPNPPLYSSERTVCRLSASVSGTAGNLEQCRVTADVPVCVRVSLVLSRRHGTESFRFCCNCHDTWLLAIVTRICLPPLDCHDSSVSGHTLGAVPVSR
jgi:hypothetical protein